MLVQLTSITAINILTMFVYCIISDHTDGTVVQRATNNLDACTLCAYLFFVMLVKNFILPIETTHLPLGSFRPLEPKNA